MFKTAQVRTWWMRHTNLGKAIGLMVVIVIILLGVVVPSWQKNSELASKIEQRQKEENTLLEKVRVLSGMDQSLLAERLEVINQALPPRKDVVLYLSAIDGLSRELGLSFAGISLSPGDVTEASASAEKKPVSKTDVVKGVHILETEVKINGTRERIYDFLKALENSAPLMQVKDVQVSRVGLAGESYSLALRLGMLWATGDVEDVKGAVTLFTPKEEEYFAQLTGLRSYEPTFAQDATTGTSFGKTDLFAPIAQPKESQALESTPQ